MAELPFVFDLSNTDKKIYGILQTVEDSTAPMVVFIHDLGSHMQEKAVRFSAYAAIEAGMSAIRLNLYGPEPDARQIIDCTIHTHVSDVADVLAPIKESGKRVGLVAHGAAAVIVQRLSHSLFDAAVLWDPMDVQSDDFSHWPDMSKDYDTGNWKLNWKSDLEVTQAFHDSWWGAVPDQHDLKKPTLIVCAGDSDLQAECKRYKEAQSAPSELVNVKGSNHYFSSRETTETLYKETTRWLKLHL